MYSLQIAWLTIYYWLKVQDSLLNLMWSINKIQAANSMEVIVINEKVINLALDKYILQQLNNNYNKLE